MATHLSDDANEAAETHLEAYCSHFRVCIGKLRSIWRQVGNESDECRSQILLAADQALASWTHAVERAEAERQIIKTLIQQHSSEIASIKAELDDGGDSQSTEPDFSSSEGEATLLRTLDALKGTLQFWRVKRASRMQAYEALMEVHVSLKRQLGLRHKPVDDVDISTGALEYLQMENGKLMEEKGRRVSRAEDELDKLRAVCRELGEDCAAAAAEVHPALSSLSAEKESAEVLGTVYKLVGSPSHLTLSAGGDLDLSDAMFDRLAVKIADMQRLKVEREAQSRDVLEMLGSLWDALSIPEDAPERSMVAKMLSCDRPQRLHKRTLDKCLAEVNRLEGCKAQAMRDLALAKARELEQLCISTRISPPHTGPLLAELDKPGQMTLVLSKLVRLVAEVQALAAKRAPILAQVSDLLAAQADSAWLRSYNQNENRYKGRDASRNMQRAIKAAKLRERLAPMMESLLTALAEWELEEGGPFLYDEQVMQETQLRVVEAELEQLAQEKAPKPKAAGPSTVAAITSSGKPPPGGRPTPGPSAPSQRASAGAGSASVSAPTSRPTSSAGAAAGRASGGGDSSNGSTTPRSIADAVRRMSLAPSSARDAGVFRGAMTGAAHVTGKVMRSNDFAPGALRAFAQQATGQAAASEATSAPHQERLNVHMTLNNPRQTPPPQVAAGRYGGRAAASPGAAGLSPATAAMSAVGVSPSPLVSKTGVAEEGSGDDVAATLVGSGVKNAAQDLFRRYLGDASDVTCKPTPSKLISASPKPAKLTFSGASAAGDDDGADDVHATKCDTPKSTATSRTRQQQQPPSKGSSGASNSKTPSQKSGSTVFSPEGAKPSRIPRVRI
ncbi:hypothetical protein PLESTM_000154200 [Pleodorina starrii]|nr:hypothetical protein PLESTM_000154200 [Pleodorina starrii]